MHGDTFQRKQKVDLYRNCCFEIEAQFKYKVVFRFIFLYKHTLKLYLKKRRGGITKFNVEFDRTAF